MPSRRGNPVRISRRCLIVLKLDWLCYRVVKKLWRYVKPFRYNAGTWRVWVCLNTAEHRRTVQNYRRTARNAYKSPQDSLIWGSIGLNTAWQQLKTPRNSLIWQSIAYTVSNKTVMRWFLDIYCCPVVLLDCPAVSCGVQAEHGQTAIQTELLHHYRMSAHWRAIKTNPKWNLTLNPCATYSTGIICHKK